MDTLEHWYLMKHDDRTVFGPVTFAQLQEWARAAQVSPLDKVSIDEKNWTKAPMYPELEMDWLLQVSQDHYYGPTTLSAMQEFIRMGDIDENTTVINCKDATVRRVSDLDFLAAEIAGDANFHSGNSEIDRLDRRVKRLEEAVIENRKIIRRLESSVQALLDAARLG